MDPLTNSLELGAAARRARHEAGLTQAQVAEKAGISRQWLMRFEQDGHESGEIGRAFSVLRALGLGVSLKPLASSRPTGQAAAAQEALRRMRP